MEMIQEQGNVPQHGMFGLIFFFGLLIKYNT